MKIKDWHCPNDQMCNLGRHRLMKAMMLGHEKIKAVRFDENPSPCRVSDT